MPTDRPPRDEEVPPTVDVTMPDTGSAAGTTLTAWLKRSGQTVEVDEPICLVSWDGLTAEVGSPATGMLRMVAIAAGATVPAGTSLALIDTRLGTWGPSTEPVAAEPIPEPEPEPIPEPEPVEEPDEVERFEADPPAADPVPTHLLRDAPAVEAPSPELGRFTSPAVRRFARERGLDLAGVEGSGRDGRVTLLDLRRLDD